MRGFGFLRARANNPSSRRIVIGIFVVIVVALAAFPPPPLQRAGHWARYRLTGYVPPPLVVGRGGRLFLGNHEGSPPNSLIEAVCGIGVDDAAIARAAAAVRPVLDAGRTTQRPYQFLMVPTAPRLYPEDLPAGQICSDFAADRLDHALNDETLLYPVAALQALKRKFDIVPSHHFHWAGEGPLRTAELTAKSMGLVKSLVLPLRPDNRASDLNSFYPGLGLHDRIGTPDLRAAAVAQCWGDRCSPALPAAIVAFTRAGTGRLLVIADSFGDEIGGDFSEFAATVWLVRMNLAMLTPEAVVAALAGYRPDAIICVYHDAGALALDPPSQASLALAARLVGEAGLPPPPTDP